MQAASSTIRTRPVEQGLNQHPAPHAESHAGDSHKSPHAGSLQVQKRQLQHLSAKPMYVLEQSHEDLNYHRRLNTKETNKVRITYWKLSLADLLKTNTEEPTKWPSHPSGQLEFGPQNSHGGQRKPALASCSHMNTITHMQMNK